MTRTVTLHLERPHSEVQQEVLEWEGHGVLLAGRRWGKTTVLCEKLFLGALHNRDLRWWVGLSWRSASMKKAWDLLRTYTRQAWRAVGQDPAKVKAVRETEKELHLPGGGQIWLRTAERPDSLAGAGIGAAVVDEFTLMGESVWNEYLRACLLDTGGKAILCGVPKGEGWHANLWRAAHSRPGWRAWQLPTSSNPLIDQVELERIRQETPARLFAQEYEAQLLDDAGAVFRGVLAAATGTMQEAPLPGHTYSLGVDWGRSNDATVFAVVDCSERALVYLDRFQNVDYGLQIQRLRALVARFRPAQVIAEANSMGRPLIEQLQRGGLQVDAFVTTNASKAALIDALVLAFEQARIRLPADADVLLTELQAYQAEQLPSGLMRYGAPPGMHDDTVMALALAWRPVVIVRSNIRSYSFLTG